MRNLSILVLNLILLPYNFSVFAQELNFDAPAVEVKKESGIPSQIGPISNLTLGGAIDWRMAHVNGSKRPAAFIHVNEFVVSANVGKHVAVSAEQLLLTSEVSSVVGQDHGFVTVSLVQLPFLPNGMSVKLGRFRGKFGLDAQVDSPANIFPSQALRSNGFVTDIGLNIDYAFGNFEWIVEVFNGPDYKNVNGQKQTNLVSKPPVQSRFVYQPTSSIKLGFSGLYGETFDNQIDPTSLGMSSLGSTMNTSRTILRKRIAVDVSAKTPWLDIYAEGIYGRDEGRIAQPVEKSFTLAKGYLSRIDVPLFQINDETRTKWALQYDTWQDGSFDGRVTYFSTAFSILNDDGWTYRVGGTANDLTFKKSRPEYVHDSPWSASTQLLVSF
jgi:hypothetical protein